MDFQKTVGPDGSWQMVPIWEPRVDVCNQKIRDLEARNAFLENVIKAVCRRCPDRAIGSCDAECPARDFCDTEGLLVIYRVRNYGDVINVA